MKPSLEDLLRKHLDFHVRSTPMPDGSVRFYIHAQGEDSDTLDFTVRGNQLTQLHTDDGDPSPTPGKTLVQVFAEEEAKKAKAGVYCKPDCPFNFCDNPSHCKTVPHCQYARD